MEKEQVMNPNKKELTALECIESLENLFKAYKKDSEFNYQLSVSNSPFNTLKRQIEAFADVEKQVLESLDNIEVVKFIKFQNLIFDRKSIRVKKNKWGIVGIIPYTKFGNNKVDVLTWGKNAGVVTYESNMSHLFDALELVVEE